MSEKKKRHAVTVEEAKAVSGSKVGRELAARCEQLLKALEDERAMNCLMLQELQKRDKEKKQ